jgi:magnesium-transporting ATPase (P-type)
VLMTKGADNIIFDRLRMTPEVEEIKNDLFKRLCDFGEVGLRTLVLS